MKKPNNKYLLFGLIGIIVISAVVVLTQNSGQLFQGDLIRSVTTYPVTTTSPTVSTTSYTIDQTQQSLSRIESKIDNLTSLIQTQNTKIDTLNNALTKFRGKVNTFAKELGSMVMGICNSSNNTIYVSCQTSYMKIQVETASI